MPRPWLIVLALSLVLAVSMAARRKPAQLACAADTYARAVTMVKNLARQGPLTSAASNSLAGGRDLWTSRERNRVVTKKSPRDSQ